MFLVIDNYDSFTYNLVHLIGGLGVDVVVRRNDAISIDDVLSGGWQGLILSPGPCTPNEAGICLDLITAAAGRLPILGVCLGHQAIGQAFGGHVTRAPELMHGKVDAMHHTGTGLFQGLPTPLQATRYHSLTVDRDTLPETLEVTAHSDSGLVMGLRHRSLPIFGVQFHPESIASDHGDRIVGNFIAVATRRNAA